MVKRKGHRGIRGTRGYKKCLMSKMKRTKFHTPKQAARAFRVAKKKCHKLMVAKKPRRKGRKKRKHGRKRRYGRATNGRRAAALRRSLARLGRAPGEYGAMVGRLPPRFR